MATKVTDLYPQSLEAEQTLLGMVLLDPQTLAKIVEAGITPDDFYREAHSLIFSAMLALADRDELIDLITLQAEITSNKNIKKIGGVSYLVELSNAVGTAAGVEHYAKIIKEKSILRQLIHISTEIKEICFGPIDNITDILDKAESSILSIRNNSLKSETEFINATFLKQLLQKIEHKTKNKNEVAGIPSGFIDIDRNIGGFQPAELIILAGRPSAGKSALMLDIALNNLIPGRGDIKNRGIHNVVIFSLETPIEQIGFRALACLARVDSFSFKTGQLSQSDWERVCEAATILAAHPLCVNDSATQTILEIRAKIKTLKHSFQQQGEDLGLVIVDYLQLIKGPHGASREQDVATIIRGLKAIAMDLDVPVLALSQLNRQVEGRESNRPRLADLRDSGEIEQAADVVLFIYPGDDRRIRKLFIGKQKDGPRDIEIDLVFDEKSIKFLTAVKREGIKW